MNSFLTSVVTAFSMFSSIPMPKTEWKQENMRFALCALPLVGAVIGLFICLWTAISAGFRLGTVLYAAGLTLIPVAVSGGIHLDGFCDTVDAIASYADQEKRREILKDSRVGAFALIYCAGYYLAYFALCTELPRSMDTALLLLLLHMASRVTGALCVTVYPEKGGVSVLHDFKASSDGKIALILLAVELMTCVVLTLFISVGAAVGMLLSVLIVMLTLHKLSAKTFGGMSGDLAGFAIQLAELVMLFLLIFV